MGLALLAHREITRAWPASLDELRPGFGGSVPTDPVTGAPFRYEVDADFVLLAPDDVIQEGFDEMGPTWTRCAFVWRSSLERDG
jgi:hypothetical protein